MERKIIIGLITSSEYLRRIKPVWDSSLIESAAAKRMAAWCWSYFDRYGKAPGKNIEGILFDKLKNGLDEDTAEEIETTILPGLSEQFINSNDDISYLLQITVDHLNKRKLQLQSETVQVLLDKGRDDEAIQLSKNYKQLSLEEERKPDLDLATHEALIRLEKAFEDSAEPVVRFPKQLGAFWNDQMVRGAFVAFLAPSKRGKTFLLLEFAMRAVRQGKKVAMFQAGDMTEAQQMKRIAIHLTKKSDKAKYCGRMWEPVRDCVKHQTGTCDKDIRECAYGVFEGWTEKAVREDITQQELIEAYEANKDYTPCTNCLEYAESPWGTPWIKFVDVGEEPLGVHEAKRVWRKFFMRHRKDFRLASYANGTLTIKEMDRVLDEWDKDGFNPDEILVDYAELLEDDNKDYRHKQNNIWRGLRKMSQQRDCLLISPTQSDADGYERNTLSLKNFSEDKRKYDHVTGFYALNQDTKGREKKIGLMRINELMLREGEWDTNRCITILQNLRRGRPFLGSYWSYTKNNE